MDEKFFVEFRCPFCWSGKEVYVSGDEEIDKKKVYCDECITREMICSGPKFNQIYKSIHGK